MRKIFSTLTAFSIALMLTACAKTENTSSILSDPFANLEDRESSTITPDDTFEFKREYAIALGLCSAGISVDNEEPLSFNGEPVKVPITVTTNDRNTVNCSTGVSVFINGLAQEVSTDGVDYDYMAVFTELEPGTAYKTELYFKPSILPEDEGKDKLEVSFANCVNVGYHPEPPHYGFWFTHTFGNLRVPVEMTLNTAITDIAKREFETGFTYEPVKVATHNCSDFVPNNKNDPDNYSWLYMDEDGSLSMTYCVENAVEGLHRLALFVNDRPVTFNGGKSFCDIDAKQKTKYFLDITLDENPDEFAYIYMLDFYEKFIGEKKHGILSLSLHRRLLLFLTTIPTPMSDRV